MIAKHDHIEEATTQPPKSSRCTITKLPRPILDTTLTTSKSNGEIVVTQSSPQLHADKWEAGGTSGSEWCDSVTAMATGAAGRRLPFQDLGGSVSDSDSGAGRLPVEDKDNGMIAVTDGDKWLGLNAASRGETTRLGVPNVLRR